MSAPVEEMAERPTKGVCHVSDCGEGKHSRNLCKKHQMRWLRHGDPKHVYDFRGTEHFNSRGDAAGYSAIHVRLAKERGRPGSCAQCGEVGFVEWALRPDTPEGEVAWGVAHGFDVAYSTNLDNYEPLCVTCHRRQDHGVTQIV